MFKTIMLPIDGSPLSERAVATAIEFAQLTGGKIVGLYVIEPLPYTAITDTGLSVDSGNYQDGMRESAEQHVRQVGVAARAANVEFEGGVVLGASPHAEIVKAAEQFNCDLIIMATHGRTGLDKLFLGSQTEKVLAHTTLPVMVMR